jgi:hypothetical protein
MKPIPNLRTSMLALAALFLSLTLQAHAAEVGVVQFTAGNVQVRDGGGRLRAVAKGDAVNEGDVILTAASASAQLRMMDGAVVAVRPESELKIDQYRFAGREDGSELAVMALVKGGFRTITGLIGRTNKEKYRINTITATIGIRGTDHEVYHTPAPGEAVSTSPVDYPVPATAELPELLQGPQPMRLAQAFTGVSSDVMLLAQLTGSPAGKPVAPPPLPPGTISKVNTGSTQLTAIKTGLSITVVPGPNAGYTDGNKVQSIPVPPQLRAAPPVQQGGPQKPAAQKPTADKPAAGKPAADKPAADKPAADKPAAGKPQAAAPAGGGQEGGQQAGAGGGDAGTAGGTAGAGGAPTGGTTTGGTGGGTTGGGGPSEVRTVALVDSSPTLQTGGGGFTGGQASTGGITDTGGMTGGGGTGTSSGGSTGTSGSTTATQGSVQITATNSSGQTINLTDPTRTVQGLQASAADQVHIILAPVTLSGTTQGAGAFRADTNGPLAASNYFLDGTSLAKVTNTLTTTSANATTVEFLNTATPQEVWVAPNGTGALGRWQGGSFNVGSTAVSLAGTSPLSAHWLYGVAPTSGIVQLFSGTVNYTKQANTSPTDGAGNVGTLNNASLSANFTNQTVSAGVNLTIASKSIAATASSMPISGALFGTTAPSTTVTCSGASCAGSYTADVRGAFTGGAAQGAGYGYNIAGGTGTGANLIQGVAAFSASSTPDIKATTSGSTASSVVSSAQTAVANASSVASSISTFNPTLSAQASAAGSNASAASSSVTSATHAVFSATTPSAAQSALTSLASAITSAQSTVSATNATVSNILTQAGPGTVAQTVASQAAIKSTEATGAVTAIQGFQTGFNNLITTVAGITIDTAPAASAIGTATPTVNSAQSAVTSASALTLSATQPTADATAAATFATNAGAKAAQAQSALTTNGTFADSTAAPANSVAQAANTTAQNANTVAQSQLGVFNAQNSSLTTAKSAATAALGSASADLATANTQLATANTKVSELTTVKNNVASASSAGSAALANALSSAQTAATNAQTAAANAQTAAALAQQKQTAGDLAGAQAALQTAQTELANAQTYATQAANAQAAASSVLQSVSNDVTTAQTAAAAGIVAVSGAATAAGSAETFAGTAQTQAAAATTAHTTATNAATSIAGQKSAADTAALTVTQNAPIAAHSNPVVTAGATGLFEHSVSMTRPITGGYTPPQAGLAGPSFGPNPNTDYVLDGNKSLVEIRKAFFFQGNDPSQATPTPFQNADIKFSGGTGMDMASDPSGSYYLGRIQGGGITVTDNGATQAPYSLALGSSSAHWLIGLTSGMSSISNFAGSVALAQTLIGANSYTLLAGTNPTDGAGNVGRVNSATATVDFSRQTLNTGLDVQFATGDAARPSARNLQLVSNVQNTPLRGAGFSASNVSAATCTGADCTATTYGLSMVGSLTGTASGGVPTGAVSNKLGFNYTFFTGTTPDPDLIKGVAELSTASAPTAGVTKTFDDNTRVRHEVRYSTTALSTTDVYTVTMRDATPMSNTNYLFDNTGNLVRIFDTPYTISNLSTNEAATTTKFAVATPLSNAMVSFSGGTVADRFDYVPPNATNAIISMGRMQGGALTVMDLATKNTYVDTLGLRSEAWLVRQGVPTLPVTAAYQYTRINDGSGNPSYATAPTDNYGNVGVLEGARLTVDFSKGTTSGGVRISMPSGPSGSLGTIGLNARYSDAALQSGGINVSSGDATNPLNVTCFGAGCAQGANLYGGRIRGAFAGLNAEGAYFRYTFNTLFADAATASPGHLFNEYIDGFVAFGQGPQMNLATTDITTGANPPGPASILTAYNYLNASSLFTRTNRMEAKGSGGYTLNAGVLASATNQYETDRSISLTGGSTPTVLTAANGVNFGYVIAPQVSGNDGDGAFTNRQVLDAIHYVAGPTPMPFFLTGAVLSPINTSTSTGVSVAYAPLSGRVTDQTGATTSSVTGTMSVNFNAQSVNTSLQATTSTGLFNGVANGLTLDNSGTFFANTGGLTRHAFNSLTFTPTTGTPTGAFGSLNGSLFNTSQSGSPTIDTGAGFVFSFGSGTNRATGSMVFGNPTYQNTTTTTAAYAVSPMTEYNIMLVASGMNAIGGIVKDGTTATAATPSSQLVSEENNYLVSIGATAPERIQSANSQTSGANNPQRAIIKFDGIYNVAANTGCSPTPCINAESIGARYALMDSTGGGPTVTNLPGTPPTAKALEVGYDATTGIRWGRWGGGMINVGDRASTNSSGTVPTSTTPTNQLDISVNNWHYIITSAQSGAVMTPVTGTFNYSLIGGTSPTSFTPGQAAVDVGTLTAASLTADFSTQKITNMTVNLTTPATGAWSATAANVPILQGTAFSVTKQLDGAIKTPSAATNTATFAITNNGSSTGTAGNITGAFTGQTGTGAAIAYSLNKNGPTGVTVQGVAALKR